MKFLGVEPQFCNFITVYLWLRYLNPLSVVFLISSEGIKNVSYVIALSTVAGTWETLNKE